MNGTGASVGIDLATRRVDGALGPDGAVWGEPNPPAAQAGLVARRRTERPALVVREATGGLELAVAATLAAAGIAVAVVNPRLVRDGATATGRVAKTDRLDARIVARFGERMQPEPRPLPDEQTQALAALVTRRRQRIERRTAAKNRLGGAPAAVRASLQTQRFVSWVVTSTR